MIEDTAASDTTGTVTDQRAGRRRLAWWALGVVAVGGLITGIAVTNAHSHEVERSQAARDARDALEPTAWENRLAMDEVMVESATVAGISSDLLPEREGPLWCRRNDGRDGVSYLLHPVQDGPVADPTATLDLVERLWRDKGYTVTRAPAGGMQALGATTPDGATLQMMAGPVGTGIIGETGCALVDGGPGA